MARMASLGGGRGVDVGRGGERGVRGLERKVRMAVVDWMWTGAWRWMWRWMLHLHP